MRETTREVNNGEKRRVRSSKLFRMRAFARLNCPSSCMQEANIERPEMTGQLLAAQGDRKRRHVSMMSTLRGKRNKVGCILTIIRVKGTK